MMPPFVSTFSTLILKGKLRLVFVSWLIGTRSISSVNDSNLSESNAWCDPIFLQYTPVVLACHGPTYLYGCIVRVHKLHGDCNNQCQIKQNSGSFYKIIAILIYFNLFFPIKFDFCFLLITNKINTLLPWCILFFFPQEI